MSSREIQRQRRVRQLEETQKLLDQFADADEKRSALVSSNDSVRSGKGSVYSSYGGSIEAQVASSQELLGRSHRRDKYAAADPVGDYADARQLENKSSQMRVQAESRAVRETSHRLPGQFGRGRGRGRSGSSGATSSRQVGSFCRAASHFPVTTIPWRILLNRAKAATTISPLPTKAHRKRSASI